MIDKIAWLLLVEGRILTARSRGSDAFYLPGGKREPGETDAETLVREIREELDVELLPETIKPAGAFEAEAHGQTATTVRMTCYTAEYRGKLRASHEIEELAWLGYADRARVSAATRLIFDHLHETGRLS